MKKNLLIAFLFGIGLVGIAHAQVAWDAIVAIAGGSYVSTSITYASTTTATKIADIDQRRVDLTCRNASSYTVYIGSQAAGTSLTSIGFPVYANESWEHKAFSNSVYALASGGSADIRCWDGKIR